MKPYLPIILQALIAFTCSAAAKTELSPLITSPDIWKSNSRILVENYKDLVWKKGGKVDAKTKTHIGKDLTLWGEKVTSIRLTEDSGVVKMISVELLNLATSSSMSKSDFSKVASKWKTKLDLKMGTKGKVIAATSMGKITRTRVAWNHDSYVVILSAHLHDHPDRLKLNFYEKQKGYAVAKLKGQLDPRFIEKQPKDKKAVTSNITDRPTKKERADTPKDPKEIRKKIREISSRKAPKGISKKVQSAVNSLNIYRYLSSVPYDVEADEELIKRAESAAGICKKKGKNSHSFGHYTANCNLWWSTRGGFSLEQSVMLYIRDAGSHNRKRRGHRRWCLNHKMGKTGYGMVGVYSAMYAHDKSGKGIRKNYSYPGHGFYPIKYVHGNAWSYYLTKGKVPADVKVAVWRLRKKDDELPIWSKEPSGTKLPCSYVKTYENSVIFEPDTKRITKKGYYLVRIKAKGMKEQYLVKLF